MKTVFYFTAEWCQPCKQVKPIVEEIDRDNPEPIFQIIDIDDNKELANSFQIQAIPTFILFIDRVEVKRYTGAIGKAGLLDFING